MITGRPLRVVTTIAPITNIVANIAGGTGTIVTGVVPEGIDSHTFDPSPRIAALIESADIILLNGLGMDEPIANLAAANLAVGAEICELGTTVLSAADYIFDFSFPVAGGNPNPHVWTNPPMAGEYGALIRDVLTARDPMNSDVYSANYERFAEQVENIDRAIRTGSATLPVSQRILLTYHDSFAYFAAEYGWTVLGAAQPAGFGEPTARDIARLIDQVRATGVRAVFGSAEFPSEVIAQIAAATGSKFVDDLRDDDLPGEPGDVEHSWIALMRFNYVTIIASLGGNADALVAVDVAPFVADNADYAP